MNQLISQLSEILVTTFSRLNIWSILDILIVALMIYGLLLLFRGTSAFSALYGIVLLLVLVAILSQMPQLTMLNWLLRTTLPFLSITIVILFQPELRRAMERLGRVRSLFNWTLPANTEATTASIARTISEIARACRRLSERRYGGLIVLERETGLQEYVDTGIEIDGVVSAEFLLNIFFPNSPLHDKAVIIRGDRVVAAGCLLPLSQNEANVAHFGTRHRAGLGITEISDAIAIIVSEETGIISLANNGRMVRNLDEARLRKVLSVLYHPPVSDAGGRQTLLRRLRHPFSSKPSDTARATGGPKA